MSGWMVFWLGCYMVSILVVDVCQTVRINALERSLRDLKDKGGPT